MHRFFIPANLFQTSEIALPADVSQQICRVLRLKTGSEILLLDGLGFEYPARLCEVNEAHCTATAQTKQPSLGEPATRLTLLVGITQRDKFELILQKCTEIGITEILPIITSRTLVQKMADVEDKYTRWKKIIREAAEQSHRGRIPLLSPTMKYAEAISSNHNPETLKLVLWEDESETAIKSVLREYGGREVVLIIGPEGGLSAEEVVAARHYGFQPVSLGKRILRMETAAMIAAGLVIYELG
jgi:16S rRNA (uracil1498-N3)-methyltransferase